jgi:hypothetical protein
MALMTSITSCGASVDGNCQHQLRASFPSPQPKSHNNPPSVRHALAPRYWTSRVKLAGSILSPR